MSRIIVRSELVESILPKHDLISTTAKRSLRTMVNHRRHAKLTWANPNLKYINKQTDVLAYEMAPENGENLIKLFKGK